MEIKDSDKFSMDSKEIDVAVDGDILECEYGAFIKAQLPEYGKIWERYIGCGETYEEIKSRCQSEENIKKQSKFSQFHYTCLESLIGMKTIVDQINKIEINSLSVYIDVNNLFLAYQAHAGRIRDAIENMCILLRIGDKGTAEIVKKIEDEWRQRHVILHGPKIPYMIIYDRIAVPSIQGNEIDIDKWNDKMLWHQVDPEKFKFLEDYLDETLKQLIVKVRACLSSFLEIIKMDNEPLRKKISDARMVPALNSPLFNAPVDVNGLSGSRAAVLKNAMSESYSGLMSADAAPNYNLPPDNLSGNYISGDALSVKFKKNPKKGSDDKK